jgi:hypothetical protein
MPRYVYISQIITELSTDIVESTFVTNTDKLVNHLIKLFAKFWY